MPPAQNLRNSVRRPRTSYANAGTRRLPRAGSFDFAASRIQNAALPLSNCIENGERPVDGRGLASASTTRSGKTGNGILGSGTTSEINNRRPFSGSNQIARRVASPINPICYNGAVTRKTAEKPSGKKLDEEEKPFPCLWPGCNYVGVSSRRLGAHTGHHKRKLSGLPLSKKQKTSPDATLSVSEVPQTPKTALTSILRVPESRLIWELNPTAASALAAEINLCEPATPPLSQEPVKAPVAIPMVVIPHFLPKQPYVSKETALPEYERPSPSSKSPRLVKSVAASSSQEVMIPVAEFTPPPSVPSELDLSPSVVSVYARNFEELASVELQGRLLKEPSVLLRNFGSAVGMDLSVFSTTSLVEASPKEKIVTRTQKKREKNFDCSETEVGWGFENVHGMSTMEKYGAYQAKEFEEHFQELLKTQFRVAPDFPAKRGRGRPSFGNKVKSDVIRFATNINLHDQSVWSRQLAEIAKMPEFFKIHSPGNLLNYLGHTVFGVNGVQLYMKVPGCHTTGHQEDLNFCSINLNVGPGDCEWFCVAHEYWTQIDKLCDKNNVSYVNGSWWPNLTELSKAKIPVFRFVQHAGEMVWVNAGTVHWVHSIGFCNNISWNMGPSTVEQYNMAIERYNWNKLHKARSIVAMINLTWNLATKLPFDSPKRDALLQAVRCVLCSSVKFCDEIFAQLTLVGVIGIQTKSNEPHFCWDCEEEIFNIEFFSEGVGKQATNDDIVRCFECARRMESDLKGYVVHYKYTMKEMIEIYNSGSGKSITAMQRGDA